MKLQQEVKTEYRHKLFGESNCFIEPGHTGLVVGVHKGYFLVRWQGRTGVHKYGDTTTLVTPVALTSPEKPARVATLQFRFATGGLVGHNNRG